MSARKWLLGLLCGSALALAGTVTVYAADNDGTPAVEAAQAAEPAQGDTSPAAPVYAARGAESCMRCHDKGSPLAVLRTAHAVKGDSRTPFAQHACESCHGASPDHMGKPPAAGERRTAPAVVYKGDRTAPAAVRNKMCLACHENGLRMNWQGSQHETADIACTNCHTIHTTDDHVLSKPTQPGVCFNCHSEQRGQTYQFSHHPIREGKVVCSDCHNPHGSAGPKLLKEFTTNEVCYNCHAEKRGPYLFEHQPVREDCLNCHTPHGSTQPRLLKQRPPFLCQMCHGEGGHQTIAANGSLLPGGTGSVPNQTGATAALLNPRLLARGCANCHSQVHGSNSPSGQWFTR